MDAGGICTQMCGEHTIIRNCRGIKYSGVVGLNGGGAESCNFSADSCKFPTTKDFHLEL